MVMCLFALGDRISCDAGGSMVDSSGNNCSLPSRWFFILDDLAKVIWGTNPALSPQNLPLLDGVVGLGQSQSTGFGDFRCCSRIVLRPGDLAHSGKNETRAHFSSSVTRTKRCSLLWVFRSIGCMFLCFCIKLGSLQPLLESLDRPWHGLIWGRHTPF